MKFDIGRFSGICEHMITVTYKWKSMCISVCNCWIFISVKTLGTVAVEDNETCINEKKNWQPSKHNLENNDSISYMFWRWYPKHVKEVYTLYIEKKSLSLHIMLQVQSYVQKTGLVHNL